MAAFALSAMGSKRRSWGGAADRSVDMRISVVEPGRRVPQRKKAPSVAGGASMMVLPLNSARRHLRRPAGGRFQGPALESDEHHG
jgi:hypothetical protein